MSRTALQAAAAGELPDWARVSPRRAAHIARVAALLTRWSEVIAPAEIAIWRATAWLHDALRDADHEWLRERVDAEFQSWPGALLHGPAVVALIRKEDPSAPQSLLDAVAYHTIGHSRLDSLGRALYLADFLEPGRRFLPVWCASLRARMPDELDAVLKEVVAARIAHNVRHGAPLRAETVDFWNSLAGA